VVDSIMGDTAAFPTNGPVTVHLRYPEPGCVDIDGRNRTGLVTVVLSGGTAADSSRMAVATTRLSMDGLDYRYGLQAVRYAEDTWSVVIDSSFILQQGIWSRRMHGPLTYRNAGYTGQQEPANATYRITHALEGRDRQGRAYGAYVQEELSLRLGCPWLLEGIEVIEPENVPVREVDHGDGSCSPASTILTDVGEVGLTSP
jgi:hypothetical protein